MGGISDGNVPVSSQFDRVATYSGSYNTFPPVHSAGAETFVGSGQTTIDLQYGSISVGIQVTVPSALRGDLNGDGRVDKSDLNILLDAINTPPNGPNDARDLNHDGLINALDSRILVTLCTHPGCTAH